MWFAWWRSSRKRICSWWGRKLTRGPALVGDTSSAFWEMSHDTSVATCRAVPAVAKLKLEPGSCFLRFKQETLERARFLMDLSIHADEFWRSRIVFLCVHHKGSRLYIVVLAHLFRPYLIRKETCREFLMSFSGNCMPLLLGSYFAFLLVTVRNIILKINENYYEKSLHADNTAALFALDCLAFSPFEGLSMNNRNSCDKLSGSSKDSEVLQLLPMTDGLSLLITCLLDSIFLLCAKSPLVCSLIL